MATIVILAVLLVLAVNIRVVHPQQAYVIERLGAYHTVWYTGTRLLIPLIDRVAVKVFLGEQVVDFSPYEGTTQKGQPIQAQTSVFFQVSDPKLYVYALENPMLVLEEAAQRSLKKGLSGIEEENLELLEDPFQELRQVSTKYRIEVRRIALKLTPADSDPIELLF